MVNFPIRKCYHIAKVSFLLIVVVTVLALFEKWRGGKRAASAFSDPLEEEYEKEILEDEARIIPGLGEGGVAAYLTGEDKKLGEESEKKLAMNVYLSDRISYNRTLKDHRNPACERVVYDAELPSASVILIFHNEPYSVVLRTIWSVINSCRRDQPWFKRANFLHRDGRLMQLGYPGQDPSSSLVYLKEIILVDDNSTLPELKGKLSYYVRTRLPPDLIRILRLPDRVGLTRARLAGARYAAGAALVFLDAHCEPQPDWLRPLLQALNDTPRAVLVPVIDSIDSDNFYYSVQEGNHFQVGGFTFTGHFTWIDVPEREKKRRGSDIAPTWSPTMAGGLFAINRAYFWELGAYDEQMAGWGGENLEMSFRIWQCGGTLETVPCSRVGHVFRSFHPYSMPANSDTHGINTARMAEVWMDEYAELFYLHRPDLRNNPKIGDVTHRKILREKLQCKSFQWYLDNIYKEKFVPVRDAYGYGRFKNPSTGLCIDTLQREGADEPLGVYPCHGALQATQHFSLSLDHELRDEEQCAQLQFIREDTDGQSSGRKVFLANCHGKKREQHWAYAPATKQIKHTETQLCLDSGSEPGADLLAKPCSDAPTQQWQIDYTEDNDFRISNDAQPTDQEIRLRRLRGQRRKSRSLLSYKDERRHKRKSRKNSSKRRVKNKFILKLVRATGAGAGTEEHLEVEVRCRHRRLYPNNTFVRDLVTILNDRGIKVINNGRVFERNKVTQLDPKDDDEKVITKMDGSPEEEERRQKKKKSKSRKRKPTHAHAHAHAHGAHDPQHAQDGQHGQNHIPDSVVYGDADRGNRSAASGAASGSASSVAPRAHRIIIEDFVELGAEHTTETHSQRTKRRKRKRSTAAPAAEEDGDILSLIANKLAADVLPQQMHEPPQSGDLKEQSMEDAPMLSESETVDTRARKSERDRTLEQKMRENLVQNEGHERSQVRGDSDGEGAQGTANTQYVGRDKEQTVMSDTDTDLEEMWPIGESRYRAEQTRRRRIEAESQTEQNEDGGAATPHPRPRPRARARPRTAPVKVVMRSNLTFNLGEDFFKWRDDDSELSIPRAGAEGAHPGDVTPTTDRVAQAGAQAGARAGARARARAEDDGSSSSDSSD